MSLFDAPLFFRHRRRGKPWSHSSKLYLCSAVLLAAGFLSDTIFEKHLYWLMVIAVLLFFVGRITRFFEYKPLGGTFNGNFKITEDHFEIQGQVFVFPKISDFSFKVSDYYGESLDSRSFGGPYSQGVGNWIQFTESGEPINITFNFIQTHMSTNFTSPLCGCFTPRNFHSTPNTFPKCLQDLAATDFTASISEN